MLLNIIYNFILEKVYATSENFKSDSWILQDGSGYWDTSKMKMTCILLLTQQDTLQNF